VRTEKRVRIVQAGGGETLGARIERGNRGIAHGGSAL
jgi:hypothetical protein